MMLPIFHKAKTRWASLPGFLSFNQDAVKEMIIQLTS
jgi:hypothetical protein